MRLHHKEEAKEAYQRCLDTPRYSHKPWMKLMEMYTDEGDLQRTLQTAIRVAAYQYGEYTEMTVRSLCPPRLGQNLTRLLSQYPTLIARCFFKLGQIHGHAKISYTLLSMSLPEPILKVMEGFLHYGKVFKVEGYNF
jgi:Chs5-Arf1p-binding protein BUD7/BCH1